ncbi:MAG: lamin tail domain-containing protein [Actinomycetales bacterium]|nr:lamin tail domain-containing protein [Actinomycetales bacterium]
MTGTPLRTTVAAVVVALTTIGTGAVIPPAAAAQEGDFTSIPIQETGRVVRINDGDTFEMVPDGSSKPVRVRLLGINTPEVTGWQNAHFAADMCGGPQAYQFLSSILPVGSRVQLRSNDAASTNRGRILRYAFARNPDTGAFDVDLQRAIAQAGLAMWFALEGEATMARTYRAIVDQAQAAGAGIWNPTFCTAVEQPDARLSLVINWDAPGNDRQSLNAESVIIRNTGSSSVDISGWLLRDSSLESWLHMPDGTVIAPGDYRVVHVGSGTNAGKDLYMDAHQPIFPNLVAGEFVGDGAYLLDRSTTPRAWFEYPCLSDCASDPLKGKVIIAKVNPVAGPGAPGKRANEEFVVLRNVSDEPVVLDGAFLRRKVSTYPLLPDTRLQPGASLKVRIGKGLPDAQTQHWGMDSTLLNDQHDAVELRSSTNVLISRKQW